MDGKTGAPDKDRMSRFAEESKHEVTDKKGKTRMELRYKLHVLRLVSTSIRQK